MKTRLLYFLALLVTIALGALFVAPKAEPVTAQGPQATPNIMARYVQIVDEDGKESMLLIEHSDQLEANSNHHDHNRGGGTCADITTLSVPTLLEPMDGSRLNTLIPRYEWDIGADMHVTGMGFNFDVARDPDFNDISVRFRDYFYGELDYQFNNVRILNNLEPNTTYYWRAWLNCPETETNGPFSETWSFTSGSNGIILPAPNLIAPQNGGQVSPNQVTFQWSRVKGAVRYWFFFREVGSYSRVFIADENATEYSLPDSLNVGTVYEWWGWAYNDYAVGPDSDIWQFTTSGGTSRSISGRVTDNNATGISGVTVSIGAASATTDSNGNYTISGLANGNYTLTPSKEGYTFEPTSRSVSVQGADVAGQDFVGTFMGITGVQLLTNPSFESGSNPSPWRWIGNCNYFAYDNSDIAQEGSRYLATNRNNNADCTSFYQDINRRPVLGEQYTFGLWARSSDGTSRESEVVIWARGGQEEKANTFFTVDGTEWQYFSTSLIVEQNDHTSLRAEVYLHSLDGVDYFFDNAELRGEAHYNISGRVTTNNGTPIAGVTVSARNGRTATTNSNGSYTISDFAPGNYTLTPSKQGYTFLPTSRTVTVQDRDVIGQDIESTAQLSSISGRITDGSNGIEGIMVAAGGYTAQTNSNGDYIISGIPPGTYTVRPTKDGYTFGIQPPVTVPSNAIRNFVGTKQITGPTTLGSLSVTVAQFYHSTQPIIPTMRVTNLADSANTYRVEMVLLGDPDGIVFETVSVTVPANESVTLNSIDFGTRRARSYKLTATLHLDSTLIQRAEPINIQILLSEGQGKGIREGAKLKSVANSELDEIRYLVTNRYVDSIFLAFEELGNFLFEKVIDPITSLLEPVSNSNELFDAKLINESTEIVTEKISHVSELAAHLADKPSEWIWNESSNLVERTSLFQQRETINLRQKEFEDFVANNESFTWESRMADIVSMHKDAIKSLQKYEIIIGISPVSTNPLTGIGLTTFSNQNLGYELYKGMNDVLGKLALFGAIVVLILAGLAALGYSIPSLGSSIAGYIAAIPSLMAAVAQLEKAVTILLVVLALVMHMQAEVWVAPAVTREHNRGLDTLSQHIQESSGSSFENLSMTASVQDKQVVLSTHLTNTDDKPVRPLVDTYLYSVDGHVVEILGQQRSMIAQGTEAWHETTTLLPGRYKAVTAIHTKDRIGLNNQVSFFEIPTSEVELGVSLEETQLSLGQTANATIVLTNTNPSQGTGDLAVLVESDDGQIINSWLVNLPPSESQRLSYNFVPQTTGSDRLRVSISDGMNMTKVQEAAYVVGNGAALAVNIAAQAVYSPSIAVVFPITTINAGNLPTSTLLSLVTLNEGTVVYTETLSAQLDAGANLVTNATVLPAELVEPGRYTTRLLLGDTPYLSQNFVVAASDTLFANISSDSVFYNVGDTIPLTVTIVNSAFAYTDATVNVSILQPDGVTQAVAMTRVETGQYQATVTAATTGTYLATVEISKPTYRSVGNETFLIVGESSQLQMTVDDHPALGMSKPITMTIHNEQGLPVVGTRVVISSTNEHLSEETNEIGQVVLQLSPTITDSYQITLEKFGFARTLTDLPVWIESDVESPNLFLDVPSVTNTTPFTVTGLTEAETSLIINNQFVTVDTSGQFTTTVSLFEGANLLTATATDAVGNTTTITETVTLDTMPPALSMTYPPNGLETTQETINVTGNVEAGTVVTVNDRVLSLNATSETFESWVLLEPGENTITVVATDDAGNTTTVTRTINPTSGFYLHLPIIVR